MPPPPSEPAPKLFAETGVFNPLARLMHAAQPTPAPANKPARKQRLALFFDGTWNTPETDTNVWRLYLMMADAGADGTPQKKFYDEGVGTKWFDHLSGGAFGAGLSENVRNGYCWLMEHYNPGDEIYLFGFSRGAFTARSLAGLIARCGLLKPGAPISDGQVYDRYRKGDAVRPIYTLQYLKRHGEKHFDPEEDLLLEWSWYNRDLIRMVGVWDTVGSIGLPFGDIPGLSRKTLHFHNTHLSKIVQHSYQALALDEQRQPYWAILWTDFISSVNPRGSDGAQNDDRFIEQRWFAGAHCNVGGGYRNDLLPQRPLAWLQQKALNCGLSFRATAEVNDKDLQMQPRDSYAEFLGGAWKYLSAFPFGRRYLRWVMADPVNKPAHWKGNALIESGTVITVNERIDLSIFRRCQLDPAYRPPNLYDWAHRKNLNLETVIARPEKYPHLYAPVTEPGIETPLPPATIRVFPSATPQPQETAPVGK